MHKEKVNHSKENSPIALQGAANLAKRRTCWFGKLICNWRGFS